MDAFLQPATLGVMIPIVAIIGGLCIGAFGIYTGHQARRMRHRERMAMIEAGMHPDDPDADLDDEEDDLRLLEDPERHALELDHAERERNPSR